MPKLRNAFKKRVTKKEILENIQKRNTRKNKKTSKKTKK